jgi:hypothetical protein
MTAMPYNPFNLDIANWDLLERAVIIAGLPVDTCGSFMWMGEWRQGEHQYKHRDSRMYVVLAANTNEDEATAQIRKACGEEPKK